MLDKVVSNMQEVRARGAHVIAVATEGNDDDRRARRAGRSAIPRDRLDARSRCSRSIPLQLLAYHIARRRGLNVDQPRNLAKTVTVE